MAGWKLCSVLLLLTFCTDSQEILVRIVGKEPDDTPICSNISLNFITLIVCKIKTKRNKPECRLLYRYGHDFEHGCGSRFTFVTMNQTVFLHLSNLTAGDNGGYICECSHPGGTDVVHFLVTVTDDVRDKILENYYFTKEHGGELEEASSSTEMLIFVSLTGALIAIIITGVILGFIHRRRSRGQEDPGSPAHETPGSSDKNDPDEPYISLQQPTNNLYQTITSV